MSGALGMAAVASPNGPNEEMAEAPEPATAVQPKQATAKAKSAVKVVSVVKLNLRIVGGGLAVTATLGVSKCNALAVVGVKERRRVYLANQKASAIAKTTSMRFALATRRPEDLLRCRMRLATKPHLHRRLLQKAGPLHGPLTATWSQSNRDLAARS